MISLQNVLLGLQPVFMISMIYLIIRIWRVNHSLRLLIPIPIAGLIQIFYSTILVNFLYKKKVYEQVIFTNEQKALEYNALLISIYSITEFFFITQFLSSTIESTKSKMLIKIITLITTIISIYFLFTNSHRIYTKYIALAFSIEIIFFRYLH